jgi:hypothetical protein
MPRWSSTGQNWSGRYASAEPSRDSRVQSRNDTSTAVQRAARSLQRRLIRAPLCPTARRWSGCLKRLKQGTRTDRYPCPNTGEVMCFSLSALSSGRGGQTACTIVYVIRGRVMARGVFTGSPPSWHNFHLHSHRSGRAWFVTLSCGILAAPGATNMARMNQEYTQSGQCTVWRVFVGFDDSQAQQHAMQVCDSLNQRFQPDFEFQICLCDLNSIGEAECRHQAIEDAATARVVVFATSAKQALAPWVTEWMEGFCASRRLREGALVALVCKNAPDEIREPIESQLRHLAHRAGLDYLTHEPDCRSLETQEEPEWVSARAANLSSVLEGILSMPRVSAGGNSVGTAART